MHGFFFGDVMATDRSVPVFDPTEKAFLQAAIELKIAQVKRAITGEVDPEIVRLRNEHVGVLMALQGKIRSL